MTGRTDGMFPSLSLRKLESFLVCPQFSQVFPDTLMSRRHGVKRDRAPIEPPNFGHLTVQGNAGKLACGEGFMKKLGLAVIVCLVVSAGAQEKPRVFVQG